MRNLAIIPARGGSKRIPRKNIRPFLGKPIIAYAIQVALQSGLFDEVMVSTEDDEIAQVALDYGAVVPFYRSYKNASDTATTVEMLLEVIQNYENQSQFFDEVCCIYATAPFVTTELLERSYEHLSKHNYDCVFPVMPFSFPIQRGLSMKKNSQVKMLDESKINTRSQDLETVYHDCGQFYWTKTSALKKEKKLWTANTGAIILSEMDAHDIDTEEDWRIAEFKYQMTRNQIQPTQRTTTNY